jgi:hypothetical protein
VPSTFSRPGHLAKDAVSLWILSTVVACMCSPTFSPAPPLHHLLSLLKTNLDPPKPCDCFWKLSTCITFPGRSALLRLFSSHTPPSSSNEGSQTCIWSCHPGFDCLLRLRHSALLGDRRQRFFFADLGSAQGPVRFLPVCLRKRLYGYTFLSPGDPVNRWTQGRSRFDPEDRDLDRTSNFQPHHQCLWSVEACSSLLQAASPLPQLFQLRNQSLLLICTYISPSTI